jgi:pimeloyl-ACP methyl ester carboxylesterase
MTYTPRRSPRHEQLSVRGLKHRLTWWGEPTDTPILLLHGFLDCGATWQFLVDCLPDTWSLVAPDWRGFGGSEWAPDGYWFPDYLADLEALLDALTPREPARVIAHSMGANIALLYGGVRPQRLKWLVNLEGIGLRRTEPDEAPARYATWLDELKQPLDGGRNPVLYRREEAEACWSRVTIPILLVAGGSSGHQERRLADFNDERMHALFRDMQMVTLPGLGHMMHHEDPPAVAAPIINFASAHL